MTTRYQGGTVIYPLTYCDVPNGTIPTAINDRYLEVIGRPCEIGTLGGRTERALSQIAAGTHTEAEAIAAMEAEVAINYAEYEETLGPVVEISNYCDRLDGQLIFNNTGVFGEMDAKSNRAFNFDRATYNVQSREFPSTDIIYEGSIISGVSHAKIDLTKTSADPRFDHTQNSTKFSSNREMYFNTPKMLANPEQEMSDVGNSNDSDPSILFGVEFKSTAISTFGGDTALSAASSGYVSDVSPIIDLQRSTMVMENSIIDNQNGEGEVYDEYALYHTNQEIHYEKGFITTSVLVHYPRDGAPTEINNQYFSMTNGGGTEVGRPADQWGMQIYMSYYEELLEDGQSHDSAMVNVLARIQATYDAPGAESRYGPVVRVVTPQIEFSNVPQAFMPETDPLGGTSASKYITKPISLRQAANGMRVMIDMFKPPAADFDLYCRIVSDLDEDIYSQRFFIVRPDYIPGDNQFNPDTFDLQKLPFNEYQFLIGGRDGDLPDFVKFQLKVVMRSTNSCEIPIMNSIRVAALI